MKQKWKVIFLLSLALKLLLVHNAWAVPYTFELKFCATGANCTDEDYNDLATAETNLQENLNATDIKCGAWDNQVNSLIADGTAVTWDAAASSGTLNHQSNNEYGDGYMIDITSGVLDDGDTVTDGTNTFDLNGATSDCAFIWYIHDDDGQVPANVNFLGWTGDQTNNIVITAPAAERHNGTSCDSRSGGCIDGNGASLDVDSGVNGQLRISIYDTVFLEWLDIDCNDSSANQCILGSNTTAHVRNSLIHTSLSNSGSRACYQARGSVLMNNFIYDCGSSNESCGGFVGGGGSAIAEAIINNTCSRSDSGFSSTAASGHEAWNNICNDDGAAGTCFDTNWDDGGCNASSDGSADDDTDFTCGSSTVNVDFTGYFVDVTDGSEDFHLTADATDIIDGGGDRVTTPSNVQFDIDGDDRDTLAVTWDIGADEFIAAGGGGSTGASQIIFISEHQEEMSFPEVAKILQAWYWSRHDWDKEVFINEHGQPQQYD